jgi:hypothetical protein
MTDIKKKQHKRWGRKFKDKRHWPTTNAELVRCGEYFLDLDWVKGWDNELACMNKGKVGAPYRFPKSLIELQVLWHTKSIPYRMIEGMTRSLCKLGKLPAYNNYSTTNRRANQLDYSLDPPDGQNLVLFSDGTGLQAVNGGEYLREKYGKKNRRWVQIVILGDPDTKEPVDFEVHLSPESETDSAMRQMKRIMENEDNVIDRFGGDGAFDNLDLWDFLRDNDIEPAIKPDKCAREDTDNEIRNRHAKERKKSYKKWARKHRYGMRWPATEGIFSAIKRIFGETIRASSEIGMIKEASAKIWAYKRMRKYAKA